MSETIMYVTQSGRAVPHVWFGNPDTVRITCDAETVTLRIEETMDRRTQALAIRLRPATWARIVAEVEAEENAQDA